MLCVRTTRATLRSSYRILSLTTLSILLPVLFGCGGSGGGLGGRGTNQSEAPHVTESALIDEDNNGVDEGDKVLLRFSRPVLVNGTSVTAIFPESQQDSFGADPELRQSVPGSEWAEITLGANPQLVAGLPGPGVTLVDVTRGSGLPSSVEGTNGLLAAPRKNRGVTLGDRTTQAPNLVDARFFDTDNDGSIGSGDVIVAGFDKPIQVPAAAVVSDNFDLPVAGDSFGVGASVMAASGLTVNRAVTIILGAGASLTPARRFSAGDLAVGAPSGLRALMAGVDPITDTELSPNTLADQVTVDILGDEIGFFGNGREADTVLGNDSFSSGVSAQTIAGPAGMAFFSGMLTIAGFDFNTSLFFVVDSANDRVLIYRNFPGGNLPSARWVLGQPDFRTGSGSDPTESSSPPASASTLNSPSGVVFDAPTNTLYISDTDNHRILAWTPLFSGSSGQLQLDNGRAADFVLGQDSFTASRPNRGASQPSATGFSAPCGLSTDGTRLAVADRGNNRVLLFGSLPDSGAVVAGSVLGQTDFVSGAANQGGATSGDTLSSPYDVSVSSASINGSNGSIAIADTDNNRVLVLETSSPATGANADIILGQANDADSAVGSADNQLSAPMGTTLHTDGLVIADRGNHRLLAYDVGGALATGDSGQEVGQDPAPANDPNRGGPPDANTLDAPTRVLVFSDAVGFTIVVSDAGNDRLLTFEGLTFPLVAPSATSVVGQQDFTTGDEFVNQPSDVLVIGGQFLISDTSNHRVLIYDSIPIAFDTAPDVIIGQPDLLSTDANQGGPPSAATLNRPTGLATDGTRFAVSDTGNHRILIWNTIPVTNATPADVVLGQATFTGGSPNAGGAVGSDTLESPEGIFADGADRLIVADRDNHRVLVFRGVSGILTNADANTVIGQRDFSEREQNRDATVSASGLSGPRDVLVGGAEQNRLYVADTANHRVLVWDKVPKSNGRRADGLIGQVDFDSAAAAAGRPNTLLSPTGLALDVNTSFLVIADSGHNRLLLFEDIHGRPFRRADARTVLGQTSFGADDENQGQPAPSLASLNSPRGVFYNGYELFAADLGNNRVVSFR